MVASHTLTSKITGRKYVVESDKMFILEVFISTLLCFF
jgi:hypothetical protein